MLFTGMESEKKAEERKRLWERRKAEGVCVYCGTKKSSDDVLHCLACLNKKTKTNIAYNQKHKDRTALYRKRVKKLAMDKYGAKCACCGIDELMFLTIDHINNDGALERKTLGNGKNNYGGSAFYFKLIKEEKRADLQILCFNCNLGRNANGGVCPHHQPSTGEFHFEVDLRTKKAFNIGCKIEWPNDETLVKQLKELGYKVLSEKLGVHADSIRKRLKRRNLPYNIYDKKNENFITEQT
jgi:hypothetical protein